MANDEPELEDPMGLLQKHMRDKPPKMVEEKTRISIVEAPIKTMKMLSVPNEKKE
jgi:hypothetical protein